MSALFATCPKGLEYLLRDELAALGAGTAREALAGVHFEGDLELAYRACLHSRLASRVLLPLARFDAADAEALYRGVAAIDWERHLTPDGSLAVDAVVAQSAINHSGFAAQRVKDAVVDQLRERCGMRPSVVLERPQLRLHLHLRRDRAELALDLSGEPLHRRGWRVDQGAAPLKENLAAAMLLRAGWPALYADGGALVDPLCGGGTLLIEAALMAAGVAAGLRRDYYGFLGWRGHDAALWARLHAQATAQAHDGLAALRPAFFGRDQDPGAIAIARRNAQAAAVAGFVHLERGDIAHLAPPAGCARGLLIGNPPYGERLGERDEVVALYRTLGERLRAGFVGWRAALLIGEAEMGHAFGLRADRRYALYNGALACTLLTFEIAARDQPATEPRPLGAGAAMAANRIGKNLRHLRKRLQREAVSCFRVYDADLPEYAAAIDVYHGWPLDAAGRAQDGAGDPPRWLHIQEYQAPADIPEATARTRLRELVRAAGAALEVPRERIAVKTRLRGRGGERYGRLDQRETAIEVTEGGLAFRVDLFDYIDTGLFLDHRLVRQRLRELARGRRMLNLFAYTGTASVYAAAGGASETVSVDLSATYLDVASWNLARNGFAGSRHRLAQSDARAFLAADRARYGLIYVDPPTFSNSKRADDFDVQRDHAALLHACADRLALDGVIVFSNNFRRFRLDRAALDSAFAIEDWSAPSIPFDFTRRGDIHGCWLLRPRAL